MNIVLVILAVLVVVGFPAEQRVPVEINAFSEVYEAAVQHLARPGTRGVVLVVGSTINVCGVDDRHPLGCLTTKLFEGLPNRGLFSERELESLTAKILKDNAASYPVSTTKGGSIRIVPEAKFREIAEADEALDKTYFGFCLPAIMEDGRAILYATYSSGSLGGKGWVLQLEHCKSGWRVVACDMVWIS